jgi:hypothetical protein
MRDDREHRSMKYMLLMYANESQAAQMTPEEIKDVMQDWMTFMKEGRDAGVLLSNSGLAPTTTATTVRVREGQAMSTDGPFAETHEQLGGFSLLECKDLDEALRWAARVPHARYGSVEVRALWDNS